MSVSTAPIREPEPHDRPVPAAVRWLCGIAIVASLALRVVYLADQTRIDTSMPRAFVAGEAVLGIMARHIVVGARPILAYGQYLTGALEQYIEAGVFAVAGSSWTTFRLVPTFFAIALIPITAGIAARLYGRRAGALAAILVALPSQFVFEWGCVAWGGHVYVPLLLVAVYLFLRLLERSDDLRLGMMSAALGLATWAYQLTIGYVVVFAAAGLAWARPSKRQVAVVAIAGGLSLSPLLYANVVEPLGTVRNILTRVRASAELNERIAARIEADTKFFRSVPLFQALGAQPRHDGKWSVPGSATALALTVAAAFAALSAIRRRRAQPLVFRGVALVLGCIGINFLLGVPGFFGQPVVRYYFPMYPLLCVLAVGAFERVAPLGVWLVGLIALGNAVQIATPIHAEVRTPNRAVIDALLRQGLHYGYGGDNMYDIIFESNEEVIIEPLEWTRYRPYREAVARADRTFYLYRDDQTEKDSYLVLRQYLEKNGIHYETMAVGDYRILYELTPAAPLHRDLDRIRDQIRRRKSAESTSNSWHPDVQAGLAGSGPELQEDALRAAWASSPISARRCSNVRPMPSSNPTVGW